VDARLFAMGNDERSVSPYLLRPLRTLEEVTGGRGRTVETARGGVETTPTCGDQSVQSKTAAENHRPAHSGRPTDHS
jgi:hypothetical protein